MRKSPTGPDLKLRNPRRALELAKKVPNVTKGSLVPGNIWRRAVPHRRLEGGGRNPGKGPRPIQA
jgi:hypothetical protein